ncbi:helix-turn-helix transcriptional regulator [Paenibacillus lactis]|uniref:helix-turn-helix domain-containing protein n=1 Tax=Paenibacillus lactis TaxID=228574 RepID=UPI00203BB2F2|nr:helix-turn-helix transcriptional regulator [Paenibacillus lactis]MCM3494730.1 helix-turn-helix transcriptional regulator [Paenibacillus lactis]
MEPVTTISNCMENHLKMNGISISQFAQISGINSGSLSRIIKGTKPISFRELYLITAAMGLPEDHFFNNYVEECFTTFSLSIGAGSAQF